MSFWDLRPFQTSVIIINFKRNALFVCRWLEYYIALYFVWNFSACLNWVFTIRTSDLTHGFYAINKTNSFQSNFKAYNTIDFLRQLLLLLSCRHARPPLSVIIFATVILLMLISSMIHIEWLNMNNICWQAWLAPLNIFFFIISPEEANGYWERKKKTTQRTIKEQFST